MFDPTGINASGVATSTTRNRTIRIIPHHKEFEPVATSMNDVQS